MSGSRLSFFPFAPALAIALMLVTGARIAAAETADESRLRQLAGQAGSYANEVRALLAKGASPNVPDRDGRTAVHGAARISAVATMRALLKAGGNPNRRDKDGNTPLHLASAAAWVNGYLATIRLLLEADADPGIANGQGRTPLHIAVTVPEEPAAVEALLAHGADANRKDRWGSTPLHAALGPNPGWPGGHGAATPDVVGPLLVRGADPRILNGDGLTALQLFVREGASGRTATLLIEAGADPDRKYPDGDAPLHVAIRSGGSRGKVKVVEALLAGGADPCVRDAKRYTPYHIAPEGGAIRYDLSRAGGGDLACDKREGETAEGGTGEGRVMQARTRVNIRNGPGTQYDRVGLLDTGQEVRVIEESGDWLRIAGPDGGEAFVHASFLVEAGAQTALEPRCAGLQKGAKCWKETADGRGCHVWDTYLHLDQTVIWSGACPGGVAVGEGTLEWTKDGKTTQETGAKARGKKQGQWTVRYASGTVMEGPFVNGKHHGHWVVRYADGGVHEGEAVDGRKHGRWVEKSQDGTVSEGPYQNGKRSGRWIIRYANGRVHEGPFRSGERHGRWTIRWSPDEGGSASNLIQEGPYVNGKRQGQWITRYQVGHVNEQTYTDGKVHGPAVFRWANGDVEERNYVNGKAHGRFVHRKADGTVKTYWMHHGKLQKNK